MTREKAIKVLEMFLHKQCDLDRTEFAYDQLTIWDAVKMASDALEQEPRWVPVTERLPEVEGATRCLVAVDNYGIDAYTAIRTYFPETKNFNDTVIAWMQLPEPYKEENKE